MRPEGAHYQPVSKISLSEPERQTVQALLDGKNQYFKHSPTLGWTIKGKGAFWIYRANSQGMRAEREYTLDQAAGQTRITAFGDSFTHADEVAIGDS